MRTQKEKKIKILLLIFFILIAQFTFAQTTFYKKYGNGNELYICNDLIKQKDNQYLIAGTIYANAKSAGYIFEIDSLGNVLSEIKFKDSIYQAIQFRSITKYNNISYTTGIIAYTDYLWDVYHIYINAINNIGLLKWQYIIPNPTFDDFGIKIKQKNNDLHILSCKNGDEKYSRINMIKIDTTGNKIFDIDLWDTSYKYNNVYDFEILNDSSYFILGYREISNPPKNATWVTRLNKNGDSIFSKDLIINNTDLLRAKKVLLTSNNSLIAIGSALVNGQFPEFVSISKLDENGNLVWLHIDTSIIGNAISILEKNKNEFVIAGNGSDGMFVNKIDSNGIKIWSSKLGINFSGNLTNIVSTDDNGYLICGNESFYDSLSVNKIFIFIIKLDSMGKIIFATKINPITKEIEKINIYPNPTSSKINILNPNHIKYTSIQLYSLNGMLLKTYNGMDAEINISEFANGEYLIKLNTAKEFFTQKIIKN